MWRRKKEKVEKELKIECVKYNFRKKKKELKKKLKKKKNPCVRNSQI